MGLERILPIGLFQKIFMPKTKVVIRNLPWSMTKQEFEKYIEKYLKQLNFWYFISASDSTSNYSIAHLNFNNFEDLLKFHSEFTEISYKSKIVKLNIEFAPYQGVPKSKKEQDPFLGTWEKDETYLQFIKDLEKPVEKEVSAEIKLERQEEEERLKGKDPIIQTELMKEVSEKKKEEKKKKPFKKYQKKGY